MLPAAAKSEVDSPSSPQMLEGHTEAPAGEAAAAMAELQAVTSPAVAGHITVSQLLLAGPYQVDAEQQTIVAHNLKMYKAKVDEVHALGKVSWNMRYHQTEFIVKPDCLALMHGFGAAAQHMQGLALAVLSLPAAKARHDCFQRAQRAAGPKKGAWAHTRSGGGSPLWGQG